MKWLVYILSVYIILLSCIPCNDASAAMLLKSTTIENTDTPSGHEAHADYCSPLCICSCCNTQITTGAVILLNYSGRQTMIGYPPLPLAPLPALSDNIWQPPQLV
ncbi:DUF6660 family protein [Chitinophaga sp. MM2321]|uniref:DUF6660 family protein n=1 Tax=Chitinophaga sp. MM2321 TaxID=3137178 RepID=UPI0032D5A4C4